MRDTFHGDLAPLGEQLAEMCGMAAVSILAAVYCGEKVERMGDLAAHIADTARFTHPEHAVPSEFENIFAELGEIAAGMAGRVGGLIAGEAGGGFAELDETDQAVDALHACVLTSITGEGWQHGAVGGQPGAGGPRLRTLRRPSRLGRQTARVRRNRADIAQRRVNQHDLTTGSLADSLSATAEGPSGIPDLVELRRVLKLRRHVRAGSDNTWF
jgi:phosphate uptake regulator